MAIRLKNASSVATPSRIFEAIQKTLVTHKAKHITFSYDNERIVAIEFVIEINKRDYPFKLPARIENVEKILYPNEQPRFLSSAKKLQAYRTAWANLRDWVSAQLALIDTGMVKMEEVFLPYMVAHDGRTYFESLQEQHFLLSVPQARIQEVEG